MKFVQKPFKIILFITNKQNYPLLKPGTFTFVANRFWTIWNASSRNVWSTSRSPSACWMLCLRLGFGRPMLPVPLSIRRSRLLWIRRSRPRLSFSSRPLLRWSLGLSSSSSSSKLFQWLSRSRPTSRRTWRRTSRRTRRATLPRKTPKKNHFDFSSIIWIDDLSRWFHFDFSRIIWTDIFSIDFFYIAICCEFETLSLKN